MTSARTSSPELSATLKAIGLQVELDEEAPAVADELVAALLDVYSDQSLAEAARVFVSRGDDNASLATVLSRWAQRELPPVGEGYSGEEELVQFVADWLMAKAIHGDSASPQLFAFEAEAGTLYLLRTEQELSWSGKTGSEWIPGFEAGSRNSPDTEAALNGIYREGAANRLSQSTRGTALVVRRSLMNTAGARRSLHRVKSIGPRASRSFSSRPPRLRSFPRHSRSRSRGGSSGDGQVLVAHSLCQTTWRFGKR